MKKSLLLLMLAVNADVFVTAAYSSPGDSKNFTYDIEHSYSCTELIQYRATTDQRLAKIEGMLNSLAGSSDDIINSIDLSNKDNLARSVALEALIQSLESQIDQLRTQSISPAWIIEQITTAINSVNTTIITHSNAINNHNHLIQLLQTIINNLSVSNSSNRDDVTRLEDALALAEASIAVHAQQIANNSTRIEELESLLGLSDGSLNAIESLQTTINNILDNEFTGDLEDRIAEIQRAIAAIPAGVDPSTFNDLKTTVDSIESRLDNLPAGVDPSTFNDLKTTVDSIESRLDNLPAGVDPSVLTDLLSDITSIQDDLAELKNNSIDDDRFSLLENEINALAGDVARLEGQISELESSSVSWYEFSQLDNTVIDIQGEIDDLKAAAGAGSTLVGIYNAINSVIAGIQGQIDGLVERVEELESDRGQPQTPGGDTDDSATGPTEALNNILERIELLETSTTDPELFARLRILSDKIKSLTCGCLISVNGKMLFDFNGIPVDFSRVIPSNKVGTPSYTDRPNFLTNQYGEIVGKIVELAQGSGWSIEEAYNLQWRVRNAAIINSGIGSGLFIDGVACDQDDLDDLPSELKTAILSSYGYAVRDALGKCVKIASAKVEAESPDAYYIGLSDASADYELALFCKDQLLTDENGVALTIADLVDGKKVNLTEELSNLIGEGQYAVIQDFYGRHLGTVHVPASDYLNITPPTTFTWNNDDSYAVTMLVPDTVSDQNITKYKPGETFYLKAMPQMSSWTPGTQYAMDDFTLIGALQSGGGSTAIHNFTFKPYSLDATSNPGSTQLSCTVQYQAGSMFVPQSPARYSFTSSGAQFIIEGCYVYSRLDSAGNLTLLLKPISDTSTPKITGTNMPIKKLIFDGSGRKYGLINDCSNITVDELYCYTNSLREGAAGQVGEFGLTNKVNRVIAANTITAIDHSINGQYPGGTLNNEGTINCKDIYSYSVHADLIKNANALEATGDIYMQCDGEASRCLWQVGSMPSVKARNIYATTTGAYSSPICLYGGSAIVQSGLQAICSDQVTGCKAINFPTGSGAGSLTAGYIFAEADGPNSTGIYAPNATINATTSGIYASGDSMSITSSSPGSISALTDIYSISRSTGRLSATNIYLGNVTNPLSTLSGNVYFQGSGSASTTSGNVTRLSTNPCSISNPLGSINTGTHIAPDIDPATSIIYQSYPGVTRATIDNTGLVRIAKSRKNQILWNITDDEFITLIADEDPFNSYNINSNSLRRLSIPAELRAQTVPVDYEICNMLYKPAAKSYSIKSSSPFFVKTAASGDLYIYSQNPIAIEGTLNSNLYTNAKTTVAGKVNGDLFSLQDVQLPGRVNGDLYTASYLNMESTGLVNGDVYADYVQFPQADISGITGMVYAGQLPTTTSPNWSTFKPRSSFRYRPAIHGFINDHESYALTSFDTQIIGSLSRNGDNLSFDQSAGSLPSSPIISEVFEQNLHEQLQKFYIRR